MGIRSKGVNSRKISDCLVLPKDRALHSEPAKIAMSWNKDVGEVPWINRVRFIRIEERFGLSMVTKTY
mgnify:CR=1 FL=1